MTNDQTRQEMIELIPRLRRFALSLTRSPEDADDLVQDAIERGLSRLHQWKEGTRLDSWMFRIMHSIRLNQVRASKLREWQDLSVVEEKIGVDSTAFLEARSALRVVRQAVDSMPEAQRTVLLLVCVEEYKYREVAQILDIPIGTVMSRLSNARLAVARSVGIVEDKAENVVPLSTQFDKSSSHESTTSDEIPGA
jgi:RNA polymerase sigma-70 factor (ECF subfamily)